ncbi:MAG: glycoside hydrolase family 43 protein [Flavobacteriaceae bacterium]
MIIKFFFISEDIFNGKDILLSDPTIFFEKGKYYLYGTSSGGAKKTNDGFFVYESDNLYDWKPRGFALRKGDAYGAKGFWAPHVFKNGKKYCMVYTANEKIAIAFSDSPLGPFVNEFKNHYETNIRQLDPFVFFDKGKYYLFHTRRAQEGNVIFVGELSDDLKTLKHETVKKCISTDQIWEDNDGLEPRSNQGPSVIKINELYYMFYSANNFKSPKYAVGYATSSSPEGPWIKSDHNPLIHSKIIDQNGPGHGDVFFDDKKINYVFHTHFSKEKIRPRKIGIVSLTSDKKTNRVIYKPRTFRFLKCKNPR